MTPDVNRDGQLDLIVANFGLNGGIQYFENTTPDAGNWIQIRLIGTHSNRDAAGARIWVGAAGTLFTEEVTLGSGYAAQQGAWQHIGLGDATTISDLTVVWPNGTEETFFGLEANQFLTIEEGNGLVSTRRLERTYLPIKVYPNPARSTAQLVFPLPVPDLLAVSLVNSAGQTMRTIWRANEAPYPDTGILLHTEELPAGVYWIVVQTKTAMWRECWVVL
ncbi:MAG: ASPIC/UnbV domain-containing protein [Saprospiraceae bacterium]